jgi:N-acetyl sugar amidotransferase
MNYQICTKCVMDTSHHPEISFNIDGICSYCDSFTTFKLGYLKNLNKDLKLAKTLAKLREDGKGQKYDCILGVSGGVDSSFLTIKLKEFNLRVLLVQVDNGWNTELASYNIQQLVEYTGFDLYTKVLDWEEFSDVQLSFIKASVKNLEAVSDHAVFATLFKVATKERIKNLIIGVNYQTEFTSSKLYGHSYQDHIQIKDIHSRFGKSKLKSFPLLPYLKKHFLTLSSKINYVFILNFMDYSKEMAIKELVEKVGWKPYSGKHFESTITIFHQSYYLIEKYGLDKRRLHLSDLIRTENLTRQAAIDELSSPPLRDNELNSIIEYVAKKLEVKKEELIYFVSQKPREYNEFKNYDFQLKIVNYIMIFLGFLNKRLLKIFR